MTDRLDDLGREAAAAVRASTRGPGIDGARDAGIADGLDEVIRRARRRNLAVPVAAALAALTVVALAVPAVSWLLGGADPAGFEVADAPGGAASTDGGEDPVPAEDDAPGTDDGTTTAGGAGTAGDGYGEATDTSSVEPLGALSLEEVVTDGFPGGGQDRVLLTDVRVAGHDGFDRIVLEFEGEEMSPYRVGYIDPPVRADGSGNEVELAGEAFLEMRFTAASGVVFDPESEDGFRLTYPGPERVTGETGTITEAVRTGDFEATLTWTVGMRERAPFAVTVLQDPLRLVVDVATP